MAQAHASLADPRNGVHGRGCDKACDRACNMLAGAMSAMVEFVYLLLGTYIAPA